MATPPGATKRAVPPCTHCAKAAVEQVRYAGVHLCRDHFLRFVEKRVKRTLREQGGVPTGATVGVAVSGGKDSIVTLRLLVRILRPRLHPETGGDNARGDLRLIVLTADEGIRGYREEGLAVARAAARELGLPHHVTRYRDLVGVTMDEVHTVKGDRNECSFCGVFRRNALNRLAREHGCDLLVTGHNLDDNAQAVLMNLTTGDPSRLARLGPHGHTKDGLVPRRLPLRWIPEKEVALTALLHGWPVDTRECPYAANSQRGRYRDLLAQLEDAQPGTRHSLLKTLDALKPLLPQLEPATGGTNIAVCTRCGEPTSGTTCQACLLGETAIRRIMARA